MLFPSNFHLSVAGLALLLVAGTGPAALAQETATLNVSATVDAMCELDGASLSFGTYDPTDGTQAQTEFSYDCTEGANITVTLDGGSNEQDGGRAMTGGGGNLLYGLFQDSSRTEQWGIGTDGLVVSGTAPGPQFVTVYGLIPSGQQVPAGQYSDTVQITLNVN